MIIGLGVDIVEVTRIKEVYEQHPEKFVDRILTEAEKKYVLRHRDPSERLAGRWAGKEAAVKALGTGIAQGMTWRDVEILPDEHGKPILTFHGKAKEIVNELGINNVLISISHCRNIAMAEVILERT